MAGLKKELRQHIKERKEKHQQEMKEQVPRSPRYNGCRMAKKELNELEEVLDRF